MSYKTGDYKKYFRVNDEIIYGFFENYRFLSNFHKCDVLWNGYIWPSSEHAYMVAKCKNVDYLGSRGGVHYDSKSRFSIQCVSCSEVKKWGQTIELREDWENAKVKIMYQICLDKFTRNKDLKKQLIDTGDRALVEANNWGDSFYGFDVNKQMGENNLGKILMEIRDRIK